MTLLIVCLIFWLTCLSLGDHKFQHGIKVFYSPLYFCNMKYNAFYIGLLNTYMSWRWFVLVLWDSSGMVRNYPVTKLSLLFLGTFKFWLENLVYKVKCGFLFKCKEVVIGKGKRQIYRPISYSVLSTEWLWTVDGWVNEWKNSSALVGKHSTFETLHIVHLLQKLKPSRVLFGIGEARKEI